MTPNTLNLRGFFRRLLGPLAVMGALSVAMPSRADAPVFAPPGEGFSIALPSDPPPAQSIGNTLAAGRQWVLKLGGNIYIAGHVTALDPVKQPIQDGSMEGDLNDFVSTSKATIIERHNIRWPCKNGTLSALRFTFKLQNGLPGVGLFISEPPGNGFSACIVNTTPQDRHVAMDAFIDSLVVLN